MRTRTLKKLAHIIYKHPLIIICIALILTGVSAVLTLTKLKLSAGYYDMISDSKKYKRDYIRFTREFGDTEMIYIVIEAGNNKDRAKLFADTLYKKLSVFKKDIKKVFYKVDYTQFGRNLLLYLGLNDIKKLKQILVKYGSGLKMMAPLRDLNDFLLLINKKLKSNLNKNLKGKITKKGVEELKKWLQLFKYLNSNYINKYIDRSVRRARKQSKKYHSEYKLLTMIIESFITRFEQGISVSNQLDRFSSSPEIKSLMKSLKSQNDGYLFTENGKLLLMMILPNKNFNEMNIIKKPLNKMRKALNETLRQFPGIKAGITGRVVIQADEMNTSNSDMARSAIISLIVVTLLFMIFFKNLPRPLLTSLALIISIGITFGITTITVGHVTLLSIVFTIILIGLGIDFGVHILSRYKAELQDNLDLEKAIATTLLSTGKANATSAVAISASFFAGILTNFKGLEELGFIGGIGILITFLNMIIVLPALLCLYDKNRKQEKISKTFVLRFSFFKNFTKYPRTVAFSAVIITLSLIVFLKNITFNQNLMELQAEGIESVEYEHKLINNSNFSSWFGAFIVNDVETVKKYVKKIKQLSMVGEVHSILKAVPTQQKAKIKLLFSINKHLGKIHVAQKRNNINLSHFKKNLAEMIKYFKLSSELIKIIENKTPKLKAMLDNLISRLEKLNKLVNSSRNAKKVLLELQKGFFGAFSSKIKMLLQGLNPNGITSQNITRTLPRGILDRFVSAKNRYLIYAYSPLNLWANGNMHKFVAQLRTVDNQVTGLAVLNSENTKNMMKGFQKAAIFALIIVFLIIFIDFKSIRDSIFAMVPMVFGLLWLFIIMGIFGLTLNFANFFCIPILIGIGIENGVQIVHRFKERGEFEVAAKSTGTGVILTALTTMAGFGSLLLAKHKGVFSLGLIMTMGVFTCLMAGMIILPVFLKLFYPKKFIFTRCPFCDEHVTEKAVTCEHCGLDLTHEFERDEKDAPA